MSVIVKTAKKLPGRNHNWFPFLVVLLFVHSSVHVGLAQGKRSHSSVQKKSIKRPANTKTSVSGNKNSKSVRTVKTLIKSITALNVPMLGPKYARVTIKDRTLAGAVYYLVSGHGGPDPGAIGHYGKYPLAEDEYAYDVTIRLARVLMEHGATVYMIVRDPNDGIRDEPVLKLDHDELTYPSQKIPLSQVKRLRQGVDAVNNLHRKHKGAYQRMVTIHVDSRSEGQNIDVFFYHHEASKVGKKLATHIHKSFQSGYKRSQPNRNYLGTVSNRSNLYVVRNCHPPTVFIELGNIRNAKDQQRFLLANNRQALANWISSGLQTAYKTR
nr:N-acetylmuramoyl-L-alanine amidase [Spirosoma luteum]